MATFIDGASQGLHGFAVSNPWLTPIVIWGTAGFLILCPVGFLALSLWEGRLRPGVAGLLGLGVTQLVSHELGRITYQARPFVVMHFVPLFPHPPNNSFPSSSHGVCGRGSDRWGAGVAAGGDRVCHRDGRGGIWVRVRGGALPERCDRRRGSRRVVRLGDVGHHRTAAGRAGIQRAGAQAPAGAATWGAAAGGC